MKYILREKVQIRPIAFLCGPLYKDKATDRRKILKDYMAHNSTNVLPIIVDPFLDRNSINDASIKIPLLEEICAAASHRIYIFLDTFSSVAELGMFSHVSTQNRLVLFLPNSRDKLTENINTFLKEVINPQNNKNIEVIYYRPKITRVPFASDYVIEYYEFPNDEVPYNIKKNVDATPEYKSNELKIEFCKADEVSNSPEIINWFSSESKITFYLNSKLMFYFVASIIVSTGDHDPDNIISCLKETLLLSTSRKASVNQVVLKTNLGNDINDIILHIIKFRDLFEKFGQITGEKIVTKDSSFIQPLSVNDYFQVTNVESDLINNYIQDNEEFVETFSIKKGTKIRKLIKYKDTQNGIALHNLHARIVSCIEHFYQFNDHSYAYRKNYGILDCVARHIDSNHFLKIDISSFFNSITYKKLYDSIKLLLKEEVIFDQKYVCFIKMLLYENILPLGFVSSPLVSDIYLSSFDVRIAETLQQKYPQIIFTRYADDMFFSCAPEIAESTFQFIINMVSDELAKLKLQINTGKTKVTKLDKVGDHVKLLGLNIVKAKSKNIITVGKKYIYDTATLLLEYINGLEKLSQEDKFYQEKIIAGRVAYIKQIEGFDGYQLLKVRVLKSTRGRISIPDDKIDFKEYHL